MPVAWANGGSWTSFDGSKAELNHPKTIEMYEHYQNMINIGCVPKNVSSWGWGDKQDGFLAGDIGMIGTGNFMINVVKDVSKIKELEEKVFKGDNKNSNN